MCSNFCQRFKVELSHHIFADMVLGLSQVLKTFLVLHKLVDGPFKTFLVVRKLVDGAFKKFWRYIFLMSTTAVPNCKTEMVPAGVL